jgi:hypothetical protein
MFLAPLQRAPADGFANPGRCPGLTSRGAFSARTALSLKLCAQELFNGLVIQDEQAQCPDSAPGRGLLLEERGSLCCLSGRVDDDFASVRRLCEHG